MVTRKAATWMVKVFGAGEREDFAFRPWLHCGGTLLTSNLTVVGSSIFAGYCAGGCPSAFIFRITFLFVCAEVELVLLMQYHKNTVSVALSLASTDVACRAPAGFRAPIVRFYVHVLGASQRL